LNQHTAGEPLQFSPLLRAVEGSTQRRPLVFGFLTLVLSSMVLVASGLAQPSHSDTPLVAH
jgi:hypothetical protein